MEKLLGDLIDMVTGDLMLITCRMRFVNFLPFILQPILSHSCSRSRYEIFLLDFGIWEQELLDLGERIGHVGTGLREDEIFRCLKNMKRPNLDSFPLLSSTGEDWKCSICQVSFRFPIFPTPCHLKFSFLKPNVLQSL